MSQIALPVASDIVEGYWTPTPIFSEINQPVPDDTTYVTSGDDPVDDTFVVPLTPLMAPNPQTSAG
jgi:hypothetical protein